MTVIAVTQKGKQMDDLISRQAAIDAPVKQYNKKTGITWIPVECIEALPSAQPEIIRCKDCLVHGIYRFEQGLGLDGYCSKAERRKDG